jgi:hypothetical protein
MQLSPSESIGERLRNWRIDSWTGGTVRRDSACNVQNGLDDTSLFGTY